MTKQLQATLAAILVISTLSAPAQTSSTKQTTTATKKKHAKTAPRESATERQIRELREQMQNQQAEIDALKASNAAKDAALASAEQTAQGAQTAATTAAAQAQTLSTNVQANADAVASLQGSVTDLRNSNTGLALTISDTKKDLTEKLESPSVIHYKGLTFQPSGFAAAETVFRSRAMNSDISTPFNSTPYQNTAQAYTSEFAASARQSRLAMYATTPMSWGQGHGYFETDFLGAGTTSNGNQTNSYLLRVREAWAQAILNSGFAVTGGQMFSLATEVKKGINPAPGSEAIPLTIDPQYHVGFTFTRQFAARFAQNLGPNAAVAIALEGPQTVLAALTNPPTNFFIGAQGSASGLYNSTGNGSTAQNYSTNVAPDVLVKFTADPKGFGHYEVGGIARFFRDRYYPSLAYATAASAAAPVASVAAAGVNNTVVGGGFFASARVPVKKYADVGVKITQGTGTARYTTSNLGDVTVKPNGTLEPLRSSTGLFTLETHPSKKLDIFGYAGGEYLQRTSYVAFTAAAPTVPVFVGYAPIAGEKDSACNTEITPALTAANSGYLPGSSSCSGHTRAVLEGSAGFAYRFYNSPTKGRLQFSAIYSYLTREAWEGIETTSPTGFGTPKATNNIVYTSFRYYVP